VLSLPAKQTRTDFVSKKDVGVFNPIRLRGKCEYLDGRRIKRKGMKVLVEQKKPRFGNRYRHGSSLSCQGSHDQFGIHEKQFHRPGFSPSPCLCTEQSEQIAMIIRGENQENIIKASLNKPSPQTPPEMVGLHLSRVGLMD
jgi:hypothetical protein